jgi:ribosomal protein S18 acetylase RimI-like enzyme
MTGQGYDFLSLSCEKENTEAISFWQAQGFKAAAEDEGSIRFEKDI